MRGTGKVSSYVKRFKCLRGKHSVRIYVFCSRKVRTLLTCPHPLPVQFIYFALSGAEFCDVLFYILHTFCAYGFIFVIVLICHIVFKENPLHQDIDIVNFIYELAGVTSGGIDAVSLSVGSLTDNGFQLANSPGQQAFLRSFFKSS